MRAHRKGNKEWWWAPEDAALLMFYIVVNFARAPAVSVKTRMKVKSESFTLISAVLVMVVCSTVCLSISRLQTIARVLVVALSGW